MGTNYLVANQTKITRPECNRNYIKFIVPAILPLEETDYVQFVIGSKRSGEIIRIVSPVDKITVTGQEIEVTLDPADTENKAGVYDWELAIIRDEAPITVGKGVFEITETYEV